MKRRSPLQGLLQDDTQRGDLVGARPVLTETSFLLTKLGVYGIFLPVQQYSVKHLSRNGEQCYIEIGAEITFYRNWKLDEVTFLPLCWYLLLFPDLI